MTFLVRVAVLGLGDEGKVLASELLASGAQVIGFDTGRIKRPPVPVAQTLSEAVTDSDIVISLVSSSSASKIADEAAQFLKPGAIFADSNTTTPSVKQKMATTLPVGSFVDVAIMGSLADFGKKVPFLISGEGSLSFKEAMVSFGFNVEYLSDLPGDAASRKLLSNLIQNGLTAVVIDALWAAKSLGIETWAFDHLNKELENMDAGKLHSYLSSTARNSKRDSVEISEVIEMLATSHYESTVVNSIELTLSHVIHGRKIPFAELDRD